MLALQKMSPALQKFHQSQKVFVDFMVVWLFNCCTQYSVPCLLFCHLVYKNKIIMKRQVNHKTRNNYKIFNGKFFATGALVSTYDERFKNLKMLYPNCSLDQIYMTMFAFTTGFVVAKKVKLC